MSFKALKTLDKLMAIYEAAEDNDEGVDAADAVNQASEDDNADGGEQNAEQPADATTAVPDDQNPDIQASVEDGAFVSPEKKTEYAKIALAALMLQPPVEGTIPPDLLNVTQNNADQVIKTVTACTNLSAPLTLTNTNDPNGLPNALQNA